MRLGDIMHSSHNVHLSNKNKNWGSSIQEYKMFLKESGCGGDICKKVQNFRILGHNVLIDMSELLAQRR